MKWIVVATLLLPVADAMAQTLPRYEIIPSYQAIYPTPTPGARYAALKIDRVANKNYLCAVHFDKATDLSKPQQAKCSARQRGESGVRASLTQIAPCAFARTSHL